MCQGGTVQFIIFAVCVIVIQGDPRYPWGPANGDILASMDRTPVTVPVGIKVYVLQYAEIVIDRKGFVFFGSGFEDGGLLLIDPSALNGIGTAVTYYRIVTNDAVFLAEVTEDVKVLDPSFSGAEQVIVVTWIDLPNNFFPLRSNTFQLAIVSGGGTTYFVYNYFKLEFGAGSTVIIYEKDGHSVQLNPLVVSEDIVNQTNVDEDGRIIIRACEIPGECVIASDDRIPCSDPLLGSDVCEEIGCCFEMIADFNDTRRCYKPTDDLCTCVTTPTVCDQVGNPECVFNAGRTCGFGKIDLTWDCFPAGNRSKPAISVTNNVKCCEGCVGGPIVMPSDCACDELHPICNK